MLVFPVYLSPKVLADQTYHLGGWDRPHAYPGSHRQGRGENLDVNQPLILKGSLYLRLSQDTISTDCSFDLKILPLHNAPIQSAIVC